MVAGGGEAADCRSRIENTGSGSFSVTKRVTARSIVSYVDSDGQSFGCGRVTSGRRDQLRLAWRPCSGDAEGELNSNGRLAQPAPRASQA